MALKIKWTLEAEYSYDDIILYLNQKWSEREVRNFVSRVNDVMQLISNNPEMYKKSKEKEIHQAILSKHNTLYYKVNIDSIDLLAFRDNRQSTPKS